MVNVSAFAGIAVTLAFFAGWTLWQVQTTQQQQWQRSTDGSTVRRTTTHTTARQEFQAVHELLNQGDHESAESYLYLLENDEHESSLNSQSKNGLATVTEDRNTLHVFDPVPTTVSSFPDTQQRPHQLATSAQNEQAPRDPFLRRNNEYVQAFNYTGSKKVEMLCFDFFNGKLCSNMSPENAIDPMEAAARMSPTRITLNFDCQELFATSALGTGNFISAFYGLRLAAAAMGNVDVSITCPDAADTRHDLILPWMMGFFPRTVHKLPPQNREHPTVGAACSGYKHIQIGWQIEHMRFELRRMAVALVGIPYPGHPAEQWSEEHLWNTANSKGDYYSSSGIVHQLPTPQRDDPPIYTNVDLDEAVLHFRCGDLINSAHPSFGFMKFGSFSRHLPRNVASIGIATQPFDRDGQTRRADGGDGNRDRCRRVVYAFVEHLTREFPAARITIRNDSTETIALTFARMIMAGHVVIGITSFGVFPGIATFGTGYVRNPDYLKAPNRWLLAPRVEDMVDNVHLITEPRLMAGSCKNSWPLDNGAKVLEWFQNYTLPESFVKEKL